ncbi:MAG: hypothetical protein AAFP70_21420, partial [Calditrichota bacterium]
KQTWQETTIELQNDLTDAVIDNAAKQLPELFYNEVGAELAQKLSSRRDQLWEFAEAYYDLISKKVDIAATDKREYADLNYNNEELSVVIGRISKSGEKSKAYYRRIFTYSETKEIRLYMRGGDDRITIDGTKGNIKINIDGGGGDDIYKDRSKGNSSKIYVYDAKGKNERINKNMKFSDRKFKRAPAKEPNDRFALDWGKYVSTVPILQIDPDLDVFMGFKRSREIYGYRKTPFASFHEIRAAISSDDWEPEISYRDFYREIFPNADLNIYLEYSAINVLRFHGFGNDTELIDVGENFYDVERQEVIVEPSLMFNSGKNHGEHHNSPTSFRPEFSAQLGLNIRYSRTPFSDNSDKFIGSAGPDVYGLDDFGQAGIKGAIQLDARDNPG